MNLVKHLCEKISQQKYFDCSELQEKFKNGEITESGIVFENDISCFHFSNNGKKLNVLSIPNKSEKFDKSKHVDGIINKMIENAYYVKNKTVYVMYQCEEKLDLGHGGAELLDWNIKLHRRDDILGIIYEPEICDNIIVQFSSNNGIYVCGHIYMDGSIRIVCRPDNDWKGSDLSMSDFEEEGRQVWEILKYFNDIKKN